MKYLPLLACGLMLISLPVNQASRGASNAGSSMPFTAANSERSCMSERALTESLATFSSPSAEASSQRELLIRQARSSPRCRTQVITALMHAMDKPDLNLERDQASFFLWQYGGEVLGALQATEALDLLISNLAATDGESPSMTHYPAVATLIRMGPVAIPKLSEKLRQDERAGIRNLAVFCIATIGGVTAKRSLAEALPNEKDKCVSGFIRLTLKSFDNTRRPNHVAADDNAKWFSAFYCVDK